MKKLLSILTVLALAALPLAAQSPQVTTPETEPSAEAEEGTQAPVEEPEPADEPVQSTSESEQAVSTEDQGNGYDEAELPRTASPLALLALLGVSGAAGALVVRWVRDAA